MPRVLAAAILAALAGCATSAPPPSVPLFVESASGWQVPPRDMAQIVFLTPGATPASTAANALYELEGERRTLVAALAAHAASLQLVRPGHHVFMAYGREAHLLEADVEGGARYYVLMRAVGPAGLEPLPVRMTDDAEISIRHAEATQWLLDTELVDKTPAADAWFARRDAQVALAQAAALAAWQRKSAAERAALTLQPGDAAMR